MRPIIPSHILPALIAAAQKMDARADVVGEDPSPTDIVPIVRQYEAEKVEAFARDTDHLNDPWRRRNRHLNRKSRR